MSRTQTAALLLCLALASAAHAQDRVSLAIPPCQISKFMARLSHKIGKPLTYSPDFQDRVLMAHVTNVSTKDLLNRVANALQAKWENGRLVPDPKQTKSRDVELRQVRLGLGALIGACERTLLASEPPFDSKLAHALWRTPPSDPHVWHTFDGPATRAFQEELATADPSWFADMNLGYSQKVQDGLRRAVPDTSPNGRDMAKRFARYQAIWVKEKDPKNVLGSDEYTDDPRADTETASPEGITVVDDEGYEFEQESVSPFEEVFPRLSVWFGSRLGHSDTGISGLPGTEIATIDQFDKLLPRGPIKAPVTAVRYAQCFDNVFDPFNVRRPLPTISQEEPLTLFVGPLLKSFAQHEHQNLVAAIPDSLLRIAPLIVQQGRTGISGQVLKNEIQAAGAWLDSSGKWMVLSSLQHTNEPRDAAQRLIASVDKYGYVDSGELLSYLSSSPWKDAPTLLLDAYLSKKWPIQAAQLRELDWSGINFYASLKPALRPIFLSRKPLAMESLNSQAQDRFRHLNMPFADPLVPVPDPQIIRPTYTEASVMAVWKSGLANDAPAPGVTATPAKPETVKSIPADSGDVLLWEQYPGYGTVSFALSPSQLSDWFMRWDTDGSWRVENAFVTSGWRRFRGSGESYGAPLMFPAKRRLQFKPPPTPFRPRWGF